MRHLLALVLTLAVVIPAAAQQKRGPSTPEERDRAVQIAHKLEANPLDDSLQSDRAWLLQWATEVPDVNVAICAGGGEFKKKYKYGPQLTFQKLASQVAFVIERPDQAQDRVAQELAGVQGALNAYQAILKANPKTHSEYWDDLLRRQSAGTLKDFVSNYVTTKCSK